MYGKVGMHCSQCKNGNSSSPFFFFLGKAGSGWLIDWHRYCFISRLQRSFSLFGFRPVVVVGGGVVPSVVCGFNQLSLSFSDAMCSSSVCHCYFFPWPPLLDVSGEKTSKYSAAGGLHVSQQKSCKPLAYCRKYLF